MEEDELQHHGVKGQKWGVRRFFRKVSDKKKQRQREKYRRSKILRDLRKIHTLSNKELSTKANRLELENRFIDAAKKRTAKPNNSAKIKNTIRDAVEIYRLVNGVKKQTKGRK